MDRLNKFDSRHCHQGSNYGMSDSRTNRTKQDSIDTAAFQKIIVGEQKGASHSRRTTLTHIQEVTSTV